jgi:hypothetical protein
VIQKENVIQKKGRTDNRALMRLHQLVQAEQAQVLHCT